MNAVYFDLETTGVDPAKDRIVQIAIVDDHGYQWERLVYPGMKIPAAATECHGITDEMLVGHATFPMIAREVAFLLGKADTLVGFNCNMFDIPCMAEEFLRAGVEFDWRSKHIVDAGALFKIREERTLSAAVQFYLKQEHVGAHGALADAMATRNVLHAQLVRYGDLNKLSAADLDLLTRYGKRMADPAGKLNFNDAGQLCFNTRTNKDVPVLEEVGYAQWMLNKDFPEATKRMLRDELYPPEPEIPDGHGTIFEHADMEGGAF